MGEVRNTYKILVDKPQRHRPDIWRRIYERITLKYIFGKTGYEVTK
jgi:hypothetical protein